MDCWWQNVCSLREKRRKENIHITLLAWIGILVSNIYIMRKKKKGELIDIMCKFENITQFI